jgi:hypothetical protein
MKDSLTFLQARMLLILFYTIALGLYTSRRVFTWIKSYLLKERT